MNEEKIIVVTDDDSYVQRITINGLVSQEELSTIPDAEFQDCYRYIDGEFILDELKYQRRLETKNKDVERNKVNRLVNVLKKELNDSDYKVIKCYEAQLAGEPLPYNMEEVHAYRNEIRSKINELEESIGPV